MNTKDFLFLYNPLNFHKLFFMSLTLLFRFFSRIAFMIKATAKKQQNKKIPAQEVHLLQRILLSLAHLSPLESQDFYHKFFVSLLVKP